MKCSFCDKDYIEIGAKCSGCGCPRNPEQADIERWNTGKGYFEPRKPSSLSDKYEYDGEDEILIDTLVHCLECNLLMYLGEFECPHCAYVYTEGKILEQYHVHQNKQRNGVNFGSVFLILVPLIIFSWLFLSMS